MNLEGFFHRRCSKNNMWTCRKCKDESIKSFEQCTGKRKKQQGKEVAWSFFISRQIHCLIILGHFSAKKLIGHFLFIFCFLAKKLVIYFHFLSLGKEVDWSFFVHSLFLDKEVAWSYLVISRQSSWLIIFGLFIWLLF